MTSEQVIDDVIAPPGYSSPQPHDDPPPAYSTVVKPHTTAGARGDGGETGESSTTVQVQIASEDPETETKAHCVICCCKLTCRTPSCDTPACCGPDSRTASCCCLPASPVWQHLREKYKSADSNLAFHKIAVEDEKVVSYFGKRYLTVMSVLAFANIIMGALYINTCPKERMVWLYLLLQGPAFVSLTIINHIHSRIYDSRGETQDTKALRAVGSILAAFLCILFLVGCGLVYTTVGKYQHYDTMLSDYCDVTLFTYTFWNLTGTFILLAAYPFCCCFLCCHLNRTQE